MLGLVSIFYALSVALIPFIAKRIISGDVGSTAFAMVRAGAVAAGAALAGVSGFASGASAANSRRLEARRQLGRAPPAPRWRCVFHAAPDAGNFHGVVPAFGNRQRIEQRPKPSPPAPSTTGAGNSGNGGRTAADAAHARTGGGTGPVVPMPFIAPAVWPKSLASRLGERLGKAAGSKNA